MKSFKSSFFKQTSILFIIIFFSKLLGFFRDIYVGSILGTSNIADAYNISVLIPNTFALLIQQVISIAFIPIFINILQTKGEEESNNFVNRLVSIIGVIFVFFSVLIFIISDFLVPIFGTGMDNNTKYIASSLLKITCWNLILQTFFIIFSARLNALKKFFIPACSGFCFDVVCVVLMTIYKENLNYKILGFIPLITLAAQTILLIPSTFKTGYRVRFCKKIFDKDIKEILLVSIPALISVGTYQLNLIVDKNVASLITTGGISALSYAQNIMNLFEALIISSAVTILFSRFSENSANKNYDLMYKDYKNATRYVGLIIIPVSFLLFLFSDGIVTVLYGRGAFDNQSIKLTSDCLKGYSLSIFFVIINAISTRFFYSLKNRKVPIFASVVSLLVNLTLNFCFYKFTNLGLFGLALATSISSVINYLILKCYLFTKVLHKKITLNLLFIKYTILSMIGISFAELSYFLLKNIDIYLCVIMSVLVFALIYFIEIFVADKDSRLLFSFVFKKNLKNEITINPAYENAEANEDTPKSIQ